MAAAAAVDSDASCPSSWTEAAAAVVPCPCRAALAVAPTNDGSGRAVAAAVVASDAVTSCPSEDVAAAAAVACAPASWAADLDRWAPCAKAACRWDPAASLDDAATSHWAPGAVT